MAKKAQQKKRVPKRIAGVKVPKPLRASAETLFGYMDQKLVSDTIAAALVGGAGALAASKGRRNAALAATLGASTAAIKAIEGPRRVGLAAAIAAAELAAGMTRLLAEEDRRPPVNAPAKASKTKKKRKKNSGRT